MPTRTPERPPELPIALVEAMRRADGCGRVPDARTREAVLTLARARLDAVAGHSRRRAGQSSRRARPVPGWAWAAAAVLVVLVSSIKPHRAPFPMDLDGNGRVDVLDAFTLRRHIESRTTRPQWDFDRNGEVDASDVGFILKAAVRTEGVSS